LFLLFEAQAYAESVQTTNSYVTISFIKHINQTVALSVTVSREILFTRSLYQSITSISQIISGIVAVVPPIKPVIPVPPTVIHPEYLILNIVGLLLCILTITVSSLIYIWERKKELWESPEQKWG
jgi:hypothetical protein